MFLCVWRRPFVWFERLHVIHAVCTVMCVYIYLLLAFFFDYKWEKKRIRSNNMTGIVTHVFYVLPILRNITPNFYFDRYFNENFYIFFSSSPLQETEYNGSLFVFIFWIYSDGFLCQSVSTVVQQYFFYEWMVLYLQIIIIKKDITISILFVEI